MTVVTVATVVTVVTLVTVATVVTVVTVATVKLNLQQNSKTQIVTNLKYSNCNKSLMLRTT